MEPKKDFEEISLDDNFLGWITYISTQADPSILKELAFFLKYNQYIFAWSQEDVSGINPSAMVHKFNVSSSFPPDQ